MKTIKWILILLLFPVLPLLADTLPAEEVTHEELQYIRNLKTQDPQAYQKVIDTKKALVRNYLQRMKSQGGERYQNFIQQQNQMREKRLEYVRDHDPEEFRKLVDRRMDRLEKLKEKNPEKFNQFIEKHPGVQERLKDYRERPIQSSKQPLAHKAEIPTSEKSVSVIPGLTRNPEHGSRLVRQNSSDESVLWRRGRDDKPQVSGDKKPLHPQPPQNNPVNKSQPIQRRDLQKQMPSPEQRKENFGRRMPGIEGARPEMNRPGLMNRPGPGMKPAPNSGGGFQPVRQQGGGNPPQGGPRKRERQ